MFLQEWKSLDRNPLLDSDFFLKGISGHNLDEKLQRLRAANICQVFASVARVSLSHSLTRLLVLLY
jgi:hypothetical protein